MAEQGRRHVAFRRDGRLVNYTGTPFELRLERTIRLLETDAAARELGVALPAGVKLVAFESENVLVNTGKAAWTKPGGLLSLWILGMFQPSPATTVVIPYREGRDSERGPVVNDAYFGKVPGDRLVASGGRLFFKGDGERRSKIGLSPERATGILGSYDAASGLLTVVSYTQRAGASDYVNSMWEIQTQPYRGDAVNSYNDGPPAPGAKPLGPFYELETSSPAAALGPGAESHPRAPDVPLPGKTRRPGRSRPQAPRRLARHDRVVAPLAGARGAPYFSFFSFPQSWLPEPYAFLHASRHRCMSASLMRGLGLRASREGKGGNGLWGSAWYQYATLERSSVRLLSWPCSIEKRSERSK